ncbi:MAG: hypothetical protein K0Q89_2912, partial [Thermomicrobiales bacterium]|nr:hypothetical protein [Thermomicrobiales bacterium]
MDAGVHRQGQVELAVAEDMGRDLVEIPQEAIHERSGRA